MKLSQIIHKIHKLIEAKELKNITKREMANRLGISERTYIEWLRETNEPIAMKAVLDMLSQLKDDDVIQVVREWK
ncbi:helix-turn-helix transcriptional regulator [Campylobacter jejuni]|uniref:helix-turn-helix domain-containing protein n=1 Tax=Campylobacter jejuni TaxID=197 RepID=UPI000258A79A|nr:helix-turn-helix transcriptional regulator [Campylobacter jejuni]EAB5315347.1 XRE family transcriptional regulator [Campylobacter jejuni]EAC1437847.1 XRE family transcriptional regulator [Campylobacter jejuni]EAH4519469.1 XRE family transcriptional regulator [Campylobacter jejuni]EAH4580502.1 XRE family transcriptional regulator [Campylobacter jejuni]EAH4601518.1 XRE family transcriptional regulator [Campylobacter jejuni]